MTDLRVFVTFRERADDNSLDIMMIERLGDFFLLFFSLSKGLIVRFIAWIGCLQLHIFKSATCTKKYAFYI